MQRSKKQFDLEVAHYIALKLAISRKKKRPVKDG